MLTALTCLDLSENEGLQGGWQHLQPLRQQLRVMNLRDCWLAGVPAELSVLTKLTCLDLSGNTCTDSGWQHLLPLQQLRALRLVQCRLLAVPAELSVLTGLSSLDLSESRELRGGCRCCTCGTATWQRFHQSCLS